MEEKVVVEFINYMNQSHVDLEIPLEITANDLVLALNEAYDLRKWEIHNRREGLYNGIKWIIKAKISVPVGYV